MTEWILNGVLGPMLGAISTLIIAALNLAWRLLSLTVLVVPDVTALPQVTGLMATSLGIVDTCYVLAFVWTGIMIMNREWLQSRDGLGELIPRLVVGLIAANCARPICTSVVETANALTTALTGERGGSPVPQLQAAVAQATNGMTGSSPEDFLLLIIAGIVASLAVTLVFQWITRAGLLIVAVGIAPIALAMHGTPQTEPLAKLWWRIMLGAPATVVLQAVALHTTLQILLRPHASLPALGLSGSPGAAMNLLVVTGLLWGVIRIPALMSRFVMQTRPGRVSGLLRLLMVQQATALLRARLLPGAGAAGRIAAHAAGGPARGGGTGRLRPRRRPAPYTLEELRGGVDLYTRAMRRRGWR
ncbi:hypothetical protein BJY16_007519 [Actinoplanes octamycinicus]|uniref:Uncharacterized protein n=1 Tax=Actinoplanes octamycinicus TaxID=135948 RepID=A0A7W7MBQ8_9ACTN|nr:conjugal transfer protein TrbL family protein [Actinoplanes octamycinicus]MBB4744060.1 hypothetical protein [Actinoplanes octamycinicus]GIE56983.1 hypothetical protein Aoc01nite_23850 [Actinoplanes octamycinicus]